MHGITLRKFIEGGMTASGTALLRSPRCFLALGNPLDDQKKITVSRVSSIYERAPMIRPFGIKGGYLTELWQTVSYYYLRTGFSVS
jgi:hypothetical protein